MARHGVADLAQIFAEQEMGLAEFATLSPADLSELGIVDLDVQSKVLAAIAEVHERGKPSKVIRDAVSNFLGSKSTQ